MSILTEQELIAVHPYLKWKEDEPDVEMAAHVLTAKAQHAADMKDRLEKATIRPFALKLRYEYRRDGSVVGLLLYSEPNAGHGHKPIARFYPEFVDVVSNAERLVELWNESLTEAEIRAEERERIKSRICESGFLSRTENGHGFLVVDELWAELFPQDSQREQSLKDTP